MYEVTCLDLDGNTINNFFQWDIDQKIVLKVKGCDENYLKIKPEVHFSNFKRAEALVVRSDADVPDNETVIASIPNILLQEPYPLLIYVYLTDAEDVSSQRTILYTEIPVRKRAKPHDYMYVENIDRITAERIKDEIEASTLQARQSAINSITSTKDSATSAVTNAKNDFIATGNALVSSATTIRNNAQTVYNNTVAAANQTQTKIENDMKALMLQNGLSLKTVNDGNGNVTLAIIINQ